MSEILIRAGHVVQPGGVLTPGWVSVRDGHLAAVGGGEPPGQATASAAWALPGFVDMHVHGGGGASFTEGGLAEARRAAAFHRAHGTTRMLASLVTAPLDELERRCDMLATLAGEGAIDGIHLEGPFLSAARCGAQDPRYLASPSVAAFSRLRGACRGWLAMITIAPELPGALGVIEAAASAGVIVAAGHTDASAAATVTAIEAGVSHATHLFNGMRPLGHREPGPAGALLDRAGSSGGAVTCEVIADGVHLDDTTVRLVARAAGDESIVFITDAMAAAGMADGDYRLGGLAVAVRQGTARLSAGAGGEALPATPGSLAGSTATMDQVARHALAGAGLDARTVAMAAGTTPARRLGLARRGGALLPGLAADLVLLDDGFRLAAVMARGQWVPPSG